MTFKYTPFAGYITYLHNITYLHKITVLLLVEYQTYQINPNNVHLFNSRIHRFVTINSIASDRISYGTAQL